MTATPDSAETTGYALSTKRQTERLSLKKWRDITKKATQYLH
jgi:hypothetical protein